MNDNKEQTPDIRATNPSELPKPVVPRSTPHQEANDTEMLQTPAVPAPSPALSDVGDEELEILEDILDALSGTDIDGLPTEPRGDTIRGLFYALEALLSPAVEPRQQHRVPFHARLSTEETELGKEAINTVWEISSSALCGLDFFQSHGYVTDQGVELPAGWSPGDFYSVLDSMRDALARLTTLNEKLYQLRYGELGAQEVSSSTASLSSDPNPRPSGAE